MRQKVFLVFVSLIALLFVASIGHAAMTIWFKDGTSKDVNKIVFNGQTADLYLTTGSTLSVAVSTIDLEGSGIGQPVGTYGGTASGGTSGFSPAAPPPPAEQSDLKAQWEGARQSATADRDQGSIHKGDTVRIIISSDLSYTIVYKDAGGIYRKQTIDATTFNDNFTMRNAGDTTTLTAPTPSVQPPFTTTPAPEPAPAPETTNPHGSLLEELSKQVAPPARSEERSSILVPTLVAAVIFLGAIGLAVFMTKQREKEFISTSQILKRQKQMELEVAQWQTEGKSKNDLIERCLRKLHSDKPKALSASLKILKGDPKNLVVASIVRDTGQNAAQAELSYEKLSQILDSARQLADSIGAPVLSLSPIPSQPARAGSVVSAGVPDRSFSMTPSFRIVVRPTSITICSVLLFIGTALYALLVFSGTPQAEALRQAVGGTIGVFVSIAFALSCAYGYWTMKRWAVILYAVNPVLLIIMGMPTGTIVIPAIIAGCGILNFHEMTWK